VPEPAFASVPLELVSAPASVTDWPLVSRL